MIKSNKYIIYCPYCRGKILIKYDYINNHIEEESLPMNSNTGSPSKVDRHAALCMHLNSIYAKKNHDYGDSFHKTFEDEGFAMARIRLSDKLERFKTLTKLDWDGQKVQDESIEDTLMDLANYALMTVLEMRDGKKE